MLFGFIAIVILGLLLIIGIVVYLVVDGSNTTIVQETCAADSDCPTGTICQDGQCIAQTLCTVDTDCAASKLGTTYDGSCIGGRCIVNQCQSSSNCPVGSVCQTGQCTAQTCIDSSTCPANSVCVNGACQSISCVNSSQCPGGCYNNVCYNQDKACTTTNDCFGGALPCINSVCQPYTDVSQCPSGWFLSKGFCFPYTANGECGSQQLAINGICCNDGASCGQQCIGDGQCTGGCPYCANGRCSCQKTPAPQYYPASAYPFGTCSTNSSCSTGNCVSGRCLPANYRCGANADCATGQYCIQGTCTYNNSPQGSYCISSTDISTCRSTGRACVNSICQVQRGTYGEQCLVNDDCIGSLLCNSSGRCTITI